MNSLNRPVGSSASYVSSAPPVQNGGAQLTSSPSSVPMQAQSGGFLATIKSIFSSIVSGIMSLFAKLFHSGASQGQAGVDTASLGGPASTTLAPGDQALAQQYGLLATPANLATFKQTLASEQAEPNVLGPGGTDSASITELQQLLNSWGLQVTVNGQFDPATANAVIQWKTQKGITEPFQFANGQPGVTPFVDTRTRNQMLAILNGAPATTAPSSPAPPSNYTVTPPASSTPPSSSTVTDVPPAPVTAPPSSSTVTNAPAGNAATVASQFHLQTDPANVAAYQADAAQLVASGAVGPGNAPTDAVNQLQQVLSGWGYTCAVTGQMDQATIDALLQFKFDSNLTDSNFKMVDGSPGVNPFVDAPTKAFMIQKLGG